ncbi:tlde1 domain-containing protein [Tardiphaga sp.]|uniref:tlde1 domain-containing protein n=1 Tax=Tardiphaga sp. TaxID=1926292 RepID=UPI002632C865|nr:tlde1 domain-containing protein [Tardiphaga sp.]MDB5616874.1 hypothetical protein [Tardiphaga sp.]
MNTRTSAFYGVTAVHGQRSRKSKSKKSLRPLSFLSGAALTLVALGGVWSLTARLAAPDVPVTVVAADFEDTFGRQSSFAERFDQSTFAERFAPVITASAAAAASTKGDRQVAWFDPSYSLGAPPERFARPAPQQVAAAPTPQEVVSPAPTVKQLVASIPLPSQRPSELRTAPVPAVSGHESLVARARATVIANGSARNPSMFEKLFGIGSPAPATGGTQLAFAGSDGGITSDGKDAVAAAPSFDRQTAVYDISAKKVYMPDGTKLEAHSGLGSRLDDPDGVREKMRGATPPHIYDLKPREALFHGVPALRLKPIGGEEAIFGRTGLLAHTYMLGPNGDSNGCVSFKDYYAFLEAYRSGGIKRLAVVARID